VSSSRESLLNGSSVVETGLCSVDPGSKELDVLSVGSDVVNSCICAMSYGFITKGYFLVSLM